MYTIDIITTPAEMLDLVRQAASWINDPAEFVHWTDQEFKFQQPITEFVEGSHPQEVFMLREGGVSVAYAELHKNRFGWVIARVLVHPEFRNRGYARVIMQACIDHVFKTQFAVSLFCILDNSPAFKLYQNLGFKALEKYPDQGLQRMSLISLCAYIHPNAIENRLVCLPAHPNERGSQLAELKAKFGYSMYTRKISEITGVF